MNFYKIRLEARSPIPIDWTIHNSNSGLEISINRYFEKNIPLPENFESIPYFVHHKVLYDFMETNENYYVVSERFKSFLSDFSIPNISFYRIPMFIGKETKYTNYSDFVKTHDEYYLMKINPLNISDYEIDFDKSKFFSQKWLEYRGPDDYTHFEPFENQFQSKSEFEKYLTLDERIKNNIEKVFTTELYINSVKNYSDIIYFNGYKSLFLHQHSDKFIISDQIISEFKKQKFKGILETGLVAVLNN